MIRHVGSQRKIESRADRNEALHWIIQNQLGRRNLSAYDRSILALKLKPVIAAKAKERMEAGTNQYTSPVKNSLQGSDEQQPLQETPKPAREQKTNFQVAQAAGVSEDTIRKVEKIEAQASPEIKAALRTGDMSINQAFKAVKNAEKTQRQEETRERKAYTPTTIRERRKICAKWRKILKTFLFMAGSELSQYPRRLVQ